MPSPTCPHGKRLVRCKECPGGGKGLCSHGRVKEQCKDCTKTTCLHGVFRKTQCKDCSPHKLCKSFAHHPPFSLPPTFAQRGQVFCTECLKKKYVSVYVPENHVMHTHPPFIKHDPECPRCNQEPKEEEVSFKQEEKPQVRARCTAKLRSGHKRCKWFAIPGGSFCGRHVPTPTVERCTKKTKRNKRCFHPAHENGLCKRHLAKKAEKIITVKANEAFTLNDYLDRLMNA